MPASPVNPALRTPCETDIEDSRFVIVESKSSLPYILENLMSLTLKQANTICDKALEHARAKNYAKLTVVVLDEAGNVKAAQREDGASMFRYDVRWARRGAQWR